MEKILQLWDTFRVVWPIFVISLLVAGVIQFVISRWLPGLGIFIFLVLFCGCLNEMLTNRRLEYQEAWMILGASVGLVAGFLLWIVKYCM